MKILVTGASGLLGLNVALELAQIPNNQVIGQVYRHKLSTSKFKTIQADLTDPGAVERMLDLTQPNWIINCAALAIVDACETDPVQAKKLNTDLPKILASHVAKGGARLLHVSTDAVFDGQRGGYTENDTPNPLSTYGRTKLDGENYVSSNSPEAIIARVNFYGWSLTGTRSLSEFFFYHLSAGNQIMGFTDVFFCPLLVNDLANIFSRILEMELKGLYHIVSRDCISKYEFGVALARQFGLRENLITPKSVTEANLKAARSPKLTLRSDKLSSILGSELPDIASGLRRYHQLYLKNYPSELQNMAIGK